MLHGSVVAMIPYSVVTAHSSRMTCMIRGETSGSRQYSPGMKEVLLKLQEPVLVSCVLWRSCHLGMLFCILELLPFLHQTDPLVRFSAYCP